MAEREERRKRERGGGEEGKKEVKRRGEVGKPRDGKEAESVRNERLGQP